MLVDDYAPTNYLHQMLLKEIGVVEEMSVYESGEAAIRHLERQPKRLPDFLFLDLNLRGMSGWKVVEYLEDLHASGRRVPRIGLLSTIVLPEHQRRAQTYPLVVGIWEKPLSEKLLSRLFGQAVPG